MQIHELKRKHPLPKPKRVGRGGKRGTTSGRGTKGQRARAGRKLRPELRDIIKKIPKKRGYRFSGRQRPSWAVVNLGFLEKHFSPGSLITPQTLAEKKLVRRSGRSIPAVKILAGGVLTKPFQISGCRLSGAARKQIAAVGGKIT
jgi:large subunit ribosomal protein L15